MVGTTMDIYRQKSKMTQHSDFTILVDWIISSHALRSWVNLFNCLVIAKTFTLYGHPLCA